MKLWAAGLSVVLTCACAATSVVRGDTLKNGTDGSGETFSTVYSNGILSRTNLFVGQYNWTDTTADSTTGTAANQTISTFCIQLGQTFSGGTSYSFTNSTVISGAPIGGLDNGFIDSTAAGQILSLANDFYGDIGGGTIGGNLYNGAEVAAALQLDIWEIEYDGGAGQNGSFTPKDTTASGGTPYDTAPHTTNFFTAGNFQVTGGNTGANAAITLANYFLNYLAPNSTGGYALLAFESGSPQNAQDQLYIIPPGVGNHNASGVPVPAALPSGLALLAGLGLVRKMRARARA